MWRSSLCAAGTCALLLTGATGASAGIASVPRASGPGTIIHQVHSLYEAKRSLRDLGYYNIQVERASLPYSFVACKRGARFHIHVNYYGDLVQVDEVGPCREYGYGSGYYNSRPYSENRYRRYRYPRYDY